LLNDLPHQILWFLAAHTPTNPVIGVSDRGPWTGAPSALVLAQTYPLAVDGKAPGSLKQPTSILSRRATESLNKLPCSPNREGFSSEKRLSLRVHANDDTLLDTTKMSIFGCPTSINATPSTQRHTQNTKGTLCAEATPYINPCLSFAGHHLLAPESSRAFLAGVCGCPEGCHHS
jgi:hypothetical protein